LREWSPARPATGLDGRVDERPPTPRAMSLDVAVEAPLHPLMRHVIERGLQRGFRFFVPDEHHDEVVADFAAARIAFPHQLLTMSSAPASSLQLKVLEPTSEHGRQAIQIHVSHRTGDQLAGAPHCQIHVHDLLPANPEGSTMEVFRRWMNDDSSTEGQASLGGYWCSITDVAEALIRFLAHPTFDDVNYHVSGRRYWSAEETREEFLALARRTDAGRTGNFAIHHLETAQLQSVSVEAVDSANRPPERPDLGPFHRHLEGTTGEGWRPTMPLRQTLMLVLADLEGVIRGVR
jgi:hypothetical protein